MHLEVIIPGVILILIAAPFRCKNFNIKIWQSVLLILFAIVIGFLGIKGLYVIENFQYVKEVGFKWNYGFSVYGAIFTTLLIFPLFGLLFKLKLSETLDIGAVLILPMIAVLRINCYLEGCCGSKVFYNSFGDSYTIPLQLIETAFVLLLMIGLIILEVKHLFKNYLFHLFLILYGIYRFFIEFIRDNEKNFLNLTNAQIFSLILIIFSLILICINFKKIINANKKAITEVRRTNKLKKYRKSNR